jgi:hypothetical protein
LLTLLSTNEAALKLGLSVQGVHYRIKTNKLKSIVKDGKTFVYVDIEEEKTETQQSFIDNTNEIIQGKDEQIGFLKQAIRWMTFQHKKELIRMEKTHNKIIEIFKSEVVLLQRAYNEMQTLYKTNNTLHYQYQQTTTQSQKEYKGDDTVPIKEFLIFLRSKGKSNNQIKQILYNVIKSADSRFIYNPFTKEIIILKDNFQDLL